METDSPLYQGYKSIMISANLKKGVETVQNLIGL
jgi:hypothetical protein